MESAVALAHLQPTDRSIVGSQETIGLSLIEDLRIRILPDVSEKILDDGISTTFWEDEVLVGLEFEEDMRLVVVHEFDTVFLKVSSRDWSLPTELLAVLFVGDAFTDPSHFLDPIRI